MPVTPTRASSGRPISLSAQRWAMLVSSPIDVRPSKNRRDRGGPVLARPWDQPRRVEERERERDAVVLPLADRERALGDPFLCSLAETVGVALHDGRLRDDRDVEELGRPPAGLHRLRILGDEVGEL